MCGFIIIFYRWLNSYTKIGTVDDLKKLEEQIAKSLSNTQIFKENGVTSEFWPSFSVPRSIWVKYQFKYDIFFKQEYSGHTFIVVDGSEGQFKQLYGELDHQLLLQPPGAEYFHLYRDVNHKQLVEQHMQNDKVYVYGGVQHLIDEAHSTNLNEKEDRGCISFAEDYNNKYIVWIPRPIDKGPIVDYDKLIDQLYQSSQNKLTQLINDGKSTSSIPSNPSNNDGSNSNPGGGSNPSNNDGGNASNNNGGNGDASNSNAGSDVSNNNAGGNGDEPSGNGGSSSEPSGNGGSSSGSSSSSNDTSTDANVDEKKLPAKK